MLLLLLLHIFLFVDGRSPQFTFFSLQLSSVGAVVVEVVESEEILGVRRRTLLVRRPF